MEDQGLWKARNTSEEMKRGKVVVCMKVFVKSDDFNHDVRLYVDGDFASEEEKFEYAQMIAAKLNNMKTPQTEAEWQEWLQARTIAEIYAVFDKGEIPPTLYDTEAFRKWAGENITELLAYRRVPSE